MNAYDLTIYQYDPIVEVLDFYISESNNDGTGGTANYKNTFISQIGTLCKANRDELKKDDPYYINKLVSSFPYIIQDMDLNKERNAILIKQQHDPKLRASKKASLNSIYPTNINDFFILTFPDFYIDSLKGKTVPCDWQLREIVLLLFSHEITVRGWNVDDDEAFLGWTVVDKYGEEAMEELSNQEYKDLEDKMNKQVRTILSPAKEYITFLNSILEFKTSDIRKIYKLLDLTFPDHKDAFKGSLITYYGEIGTPNNTLFSLV